jgi:hypothetical protein
VIPRYLPPSPNASRAWEWGDQAHIEELFAPSRVRFEFVRATTRWEFPSIDAFMEYMEAKAGRLVQAKPYLESIGKWGQARADTLELARSANLATDGTWQADQEFLLAIGRAQA